MYEFPLSKRIENQIKSYFTNLEKIAFGFGMLANQMFPAALGIFIIVVLLITYWSEFF